MTFVAIVVMSALAVVWAFAYLRLRERVEAFVDVFADAVCFNLGPHLTCAEVDEFAKLMRAAGYHADEIALMIQCHGEYDEEGDSHFEATDG